MSDILWGDKIDAGEDAGAPSTDTASLDMIDSSWGDESIAELTDVAQAEADSLQVAQAQYELDLAYLEADTRNRLGAGDAPRGVDIGGWGDDTALDTLPSLAAEGDGTDLAKEPVVDDSWGDEDLSSEIPDATDDSQIDGWLGEINPNYNGEFDDPYSNNCGKCSESVFKMFEGEVASSAGTGTYDTPEMQDVTGVEQVSMSPSEIEAVLSAGGPGSHALIGVDWEGGGGHWYNAYYDGKQVWAVDGQTGTRTPWPGVDAASVKNWDAGIKIK